MSKTGISIVLAGLLLSSQVFAGGRHHDDDDDYHRYRHAPRAKHVVVHHVYEEPRVVYRDRVVYQDHGYCQLAPNGLM